GGERGVAERSVVGRVSHANVRRSGSCNPRLHPMIYASWMAPSCGLACVDPTGKAAVVRPPRRETLNTWRPRSHGLGGPEKSPGTIDWPPRHIPSPSERSRDFGGSDPGRDPGRSSARMTGAARREVDRRPYGATARHGLDTRPVAPVGDRAE